MATFGKWLPARLTICSHCLLSIIFIYIYLFPVLVLRAGFGFLIAPVPVHFFPITFPIVHVGNTEWPIDIPVGFFCFVGLRYSLESPQ